MSNDKDTRDEKLAGDLKVNLSAGENKIKYYECNEDNCIFEILGEKSDKQEASENKNSTDFHSMNSEKKYIKQESKKDVFKSGRIVVKSIIDYGKREALKGVKINLYKINGLSPILIKSKITNDNGEVVFSDVEEGSYRIIELVDKEYFEKPKYIDWNEITISWNNNKEKILIINKLRKYRNRRN